jgi:hypothetical protein
MKIPRLPLKSSFKYKRRMKFSPMNKKEHGMTHIESKSFEAMMVRLLLKTGPW